MFESRELIRCVPSFVVKELPHPRPPFPVLILCRALLWNPKLEITCFSPLFSSSLQRREGERFARTVRGFGGPSVVRGSGGDGS